MISSGQYFIILYIFFIEFKYFYLAVINIKVCRDHSLAQHILRHAAVAALVILL